MASDGRTHSVFSADHPSRPHLSHSAYSNSAHDSSGSLNDTAYNGSEGRINDTTSYTDFDQAGQEFQLSTPSRSLQPARQALGARLMSSWSNAQPAASALSRKGSVLHSRAKSLAAFVPKLNQSSTSVSTTPEKTHTPPNRIFGDLFNGESAPIKLGAPVSPTKEKEESEFVMEYKPSFTERPGGLQRRQMTAQSIVSTSSTNRPVSWFGRKSVIVSPTPQQIQDELANMNINASLFPNGQVDPLNPAAFNDLLLNATNLLQRMQIAYKEKIEYIASIRPEVEAQREEVEEAETRSKHLKMQLEEMSHKAQEQDAVMQEMAHQLAEEKIKVHEAREAARTVRLVRRSDEEHQAVSDNETPTRRRKRGSVSNASDSGFESDMESVFSVTSTINTPISPPSTSHGVDNAIRSWNIRHMKEREDLARRPSTSTAGSNNPNANRLGREGAAWATIDALRSENQDLKKEMEEMQRTLQGCIDLVSV